MHRYTLGAMTIDIFWGSGSPYSWRVMLAAEVKGIEYQSNLIQFSAGDHKKPEFLAMNPHGKVPVLRDGDFVVYESLAIMAYIDRLKPEPLLFGNTAREHGDIWRLICECDNYFAPPGSQLARPIFMGQALDNPEKYSAIIETMFKELGRVESLLSKSGDWLVGDAISAADIVHYPFLATLLRMAAKPEAKAVGLVLDSYDDKHPAIAAWMKRIEALPGYERTYPPHWR